MTPSANGLASIVPTQESARMFRKKSEVLFYSLCIAAGVLIVYTAPVETRGPKDGSDAALAALTGMGGGQNRPAPGKGKGGSLFDSSFWKAGTNGDAIPDEAPGKGNEEEPEILEKVSEGNPINPQTGMGYTDEQMAQFDKLREQFPGNSLIPQRSTPEMQQKMEQERRQIVSIQERMSAKKASAEDITTFYDFQAKGMKDRTQLLDYVLQKMGDDMDAEMKKKYNEVLEANRRQMQNLEEQKKRAIQEAGR